MEIVGDPDLRTSEEARQYLVKLRQMKLSESARVVVDTSAAAWEEGGAPGLSRLPLLNRIFDWAYRAFARNRYRVSRACRLNP